MIGHEEIIIAGFGGQGILSAGRILAYAGMLEEKRIMAAIIWSGNERRYGKL